jgi:uncharacterized protein YggU (UPF0235/DUF167 family)
MLINVSIKPNQKYDQLWRTPDGNLSAYITALPKDEESNKYLVQFLARRFGVQSKLVTIIKGIHGSEKTVVVSAPEDKLRRTITRLEPAATQSSLL